MMAIRINRQGREDKNFPKDSVLVLETDSTQQDVPDHFIPKFRDERIFCAMLL